MVSRKAHNLKAPVRFGFPQQENIKAGITGFYVFLEKVLEIYCPYAIFSRLLNNSNAVDVANTASTSLGQKASKLSFDPRSSM